MNALFGYAANGFRRNPSAVGEAEDSASTESSTSSPSFHTPTGTAGGVELASPDSPAEDDEIVIAIMGPTGVGKSNFVRCLMESSAPVGVGHGLQSCTGKVHTFPVTHNGYHLRFIDTPGFNDTHRSDAHILKDLSVWLEELYRCNKRLSGILYLQRITENRVSGSAMKSMEVFKHLVGNASMANVILTTTHWDQIDIPTGLERERELSTTPKFWKPFIEASAGTARFDNQPATAWSIISRLVEKAPTVLAIQRELVDENKTLSETLACKAMQGNLARMGSERQAELESIQAMLQEALQKKDKETAGLLAKEKALFLRQIQDIESQQRELLEAQTRELKMQVRTLTLELDHMKSQHGIWGVLETVIGTFLSELVRAPPSYGRGGGLGVEGSFPGFPGAFGHGGR